MDVNKLANRHIYMLLDRLDSQGEIVSNNTREAIKAQFRKFKDDIEDGAKKVGNERKQSRF